jgi:hypothetical protein
MSPKPRPLEERFWSHINKRGPNECWLWTACMKPNGYGDFRLSGKGIYAHRLAFELAIGPVGEWLVCHSCDNRACCNPAHLFLGTHADNMADAATKGRMAKKERNGNSRLTVQLAGQIRNAPGKQRDIAAAFGICQGTVWQIKSGRTWI